MPVIAGRKGTSMDAAQRKSIDIAMDLIRETGTCAISEEDFAALYDENERLRTVLERITQLVGEADEFHTAQRAARGGLRGWDPRKMQPLNHVVSRHER